MLRGINFSLEGSSSIYYNLVRIAAELGMGLLTDLGIRSSISDIFATIIRGDISVLSV
jgi:hypothetical protein